MVSEFQWHRVVFQKATLKKTQGDRSNMVAKSNHPCWWNPGLSQETLVRTGYPQSSRASPWKKYSESSWCDQLTWNVSRFWTSQVTLEYWLMQWIGNAFYGGFLNRGTPKSSHLSIFKQDFQFKPSIFGYPHLWKRYIYSSLFNTHPARIWATAWVWSSYIEASKLRSGASMLAQCVAPVDVMSVGF